jgi:hypothetical protein
LVSHGRIAKSQRANILLTTAIQNVYKTNQDFGNDTMSLPGVEMDACSVLLAREAS